MLRKIATLEPESALASALEARSGHQTLRGPVCPVRRILDALDAGDAAKLTEFIDDRPDVAASEITAALRESGHHIAGAAIARHRRRATGTGCGCRT